MSMQLPKTLKMIAEYCGEEVMWAVWESYAGAHLCIPAVIHVEHHLVENLGVDYAVKLSQAFGGETLDIQKFDHVAIVKRLERNQSIISDAQQGITAAAIARKHKLTERQIFNILRAAKTQPDLQEDLFHE